MSYSTIYFYDLIIIFHRFQSGQKVLCSVYTLNNKNVSSLLENILHLSSISHSIQNYVENSICNVKMQWPLFGCTTIHHDKANKKFFGKLRRQEVFLRNFCTKMSPSKSQIHKSKKRKYRIHCINCRTFNNCRSRIRAIYTDKIKNS